MDPRDVDSLNRNAYDAIAAEYTDSLRVTTRIFHSLSVNFVQSAATRLSGATTLNLGSGRGFLNDILVTISRRVIALDLSINMLRLTDDTASKICASAFHLPLKDGSVDATVSSLAGAFLLPESVAEIARILRGPGLLLLTNPTKRWSDAIRTSDALQRTTFVTLDHIHHTTYSFTYEEAELERLLEDGGFTIERLDVVSAATEPASPQLHTLIAHRQV